MKLKIVFCFLSLFLLVALSACSSNGTEFDDSPGKFDTFAQCLTEKGLTMYGTEWCTHCKDQKAMFGNSFRYIDYVDCDENKQECLDNGVSGYPTWRYDGKPYVGTQQLSTFARLTGCSLKEDE